MKIITRSILFVLAVLFVNAIVGFAVHYTAPKISTDLAVEAVNGNSSAFQAARLANEHLAFGFKLTGMVVLAVLFVMLFHSVVFPPKSTKIENEKT